MPIEFVYQCDIMSTVPRGTQKKKGSKKSMKYQFLTNLINLMATSEEYGVRRNFYHQFNGAYTALFLTQVLTTDEFLFYGELSRIILDELYE